LESLWTNTDFPFQLIICDDASNAETQEYIFDLVRAGKVSTALFNTGHNMGIGIAFNRGAAIARGKWLFKLDADLIYEPQWLSQAIDLLSNQVIGCLGLFKYWHEPCHFDHELIVDQGTYFEVQDFVGSAIGMRREVYDQFGPWSEQGHAFAEDVLYKRAVQVGGLCMALPKEDLVENFGFGANRSALIRKADWVGGNHEYNIPNTEPSLFGPGIESQVREENRENLDLLAVERCL